jgi:hypothetical protein
MEFNEHPNCLTLMFLQSPMQIQMNNDKYLPWNQGAAWPTQTAAMVAAAWWANALQDAVSTISYIYQNLQRLAPSLFY